MTVEALKELEAKVAAGELLDPDTDAYPQSVGKLFEQCVDDPFGALWEAFTGAYEGSLDAAKALHETVLPDWVFDINRISVKLNHASLPSVYGQRCSKEVSRLWLLAIIRALIEESKHD